MNAEKITTIVLVILVLALLGWVIYKMVKGGKAPEVQPEHFKLQDPELVLRAVGKPLVKKEPFELEGMHQDIGQARRRAMARRMQNEMYEPAVHQEMTHEVHRVEKPKEEVHKQMPPTAANVPAEHAKPVDFGRPYVDAKVGVLIDGPGYEQQTDDWTFGEPTVGIPSDYYFLDDGSGGGVSIQHNLCSKSCCAEQWPTPFKMKYDPYVCDLKRKGELVGSNYFCNNTFQDSGCLCLTRAQGQFLYNRGSNGREWF
jgi:hypothetical protein